MSWVTFTIAMLLSAFFLVIFFRIIREILMINAWVDKRRAMNKFSSEAERSSKAEDSVDEFTANP